MTNYNLEEFKAWLEANPERKEGLTSWKGMLMNQITTNRHLEKLIQPEDYQGLLFASHPSWQPYRQIVQKWKAEVDNREREREREREQLNQEIQYLEASPQNNSQYQAVLAQKKKRLAELEAKAKQDKLNNSSLETTETKSNNSYLLLWIYGSLVGLGLIGLVIYLLRRKGK